MIKNITLGSDPEVFLVDADNSERYISAIGLIGGSKEFPKPVANGISLQEDCTAVEFTIPPSKTEDDFAINLENGLLEVVKVASQHNLNLSIVASATFDGEQLVHPLASLAGCDPDFCVWTKSMNKSAELLSTNLRVAGAHVHVGYEDPSVKVNMNIIKAMDLFLGVPAVLMDNDTRRRELYGKAGCFRHKSYGVEYRTLSNFWLKDAALMKWVFRNTMKAIEYVNEDQNYLLDNYKDKIVNCINNNDKTLAEELVKEFNIPVEVCVEL